jgi:hypothetical protein
VLAAGAAWTLRMKHAHYMGYACAATATAYGTAPPAPHHTQQCDAVQAQPHPGPATDQPALHPPPCRGFITVFILLIFYGAPLSVLAEVLRTRNSVSLFWPLSVMAAVNGCLWMSYGLAVNDAFIWAPNAVGAFFGFVQLILICTFPARPPSSRCVVLMS